jgi:hypothetical protein
MASSKSSREASRNTLAGSMLRVHSLAICSAGGASLQQEGGPGVGPNEGVGEEGGEGNEGGRGEGGETKVKDSTTMSTPSWGRVGLRCRRPETRTTAPDLVAFMVAAAAESPTRPRSVAPAIS